MTSLLKDPIGRCRVVMVALAISFLAVGWLVPKPWDRNIAKRVEQGKTTQPQDYGARLLVWIALGNALGCLVLAGTASLWGRPLLRRPGSADDQTAGKGGKKRVEVWFVTGVALAMVLSVILRVPLAEKSLWWDELWTVKHAIVGYRTPDPKADGGEKFIDRDWARTFWYYEKPTNHAGFSVLSRVGIDVWRSLTGAPEWAFEEWVLRLPSLAASAGAVGLIGIFGRGLFGGWGGLLAAFMLTVHPWFIRYGVDARAFGLNVFLSLAVSYCWWQMIRSNGKWRWLVPGAAATVWLIFSFPYNLFLPISLVIVLTAAAFIRGSGVGWGLWGRYMIASLVAVLAFAQIASPWVPQVMTWSLSVEGGDKTGPRLNEEEMAHGPRLNADGLAQSWVSFTTGLPMAGESSKEAEGIPSLAGVSSEQPWVSGLVWWVLPILFCVGVSPHFRRKKTQGDGEARRLDDWLFLAWLLSLALPIGFALWRQHYFYDRYLIYALPAVLLAIVRGGVRTGGVAFHRDSFRTQIGGGILATIVAILLLTVQIPKIDMLLQRPIAPARDVADFVRDEIYAAAPGAIVIGYGLGGDSPLIYEPRIRFTFTPEVLRGELQKGMAEQKPIYVFYGYNSFNRSNTDGNAREAFVWLDDQELFETVKSFKGIESQFYYRVLKFIGKDLHLPEPAPL